MSQDYTGLPLLTAPLMDEVTVALDSQLTDYRVPVKMGIFNDFIMSASTASVGTTVKVRLNYDTAGQSDNNHGGLLSPPAQWSYNNVEGRYLYLTTNQADAGKTVTFQFRGR